MVTLLPTDLNFCKAGESFNSDATVSAGLSCYAMSNSLLGWTNKASWSELTCNDINSATKTEVKEHGSVETSHLKDIMAHNAYLGGCCGNGSVTNAMCVSTELHDCAFKLASKAGNPCKSDACNRDAESEECARVVLDYCGGEGSNDPGCAFAVSNTTDGHNATEAAAEECVDHDAQLAEFSMGAVTNCASHQAFCTDDRPLRIMKLKRCLTATLTRNTQFLNPTHAFMHACRLARSPA